jgi:hypothetical protein
MTQTIAESLVEQGWNSGQAEATRKYLRMLLENRFGPLPEALVAQISAVTDLATLDRLFQQALVVGKLEELRL